MVDGGYGDNKQPKGTIGCRLRLYYNKTTPADSYITFELWGGPQAFVCDANDEYTIDTKAISSMRFRTSKATNGKFKIVTLE